MRNEAVRNQAVIVTACLFLGACVSAAETADNPGTDTSSTTITSTASVTTTDSTTTPTTPTSAVQAPDDGAYVPPEPAHSDAEVLQLASDLKLERLIVQDGTDHVAVADGQVHRQSWPAERWVHSDGKFIYWSEYENDEAASITTLVASNAASFDWNVVCSFDDWEIHHVTERSDRTLVAGVERPFGFQDEVDPGVGRYEVPAYALECGDTAIPPVRIESFRGYGGGDGGSTGVERVGDRIFTFEGDSEGNARFFNEDGLAITGDDIASHLLYNSDASTAIYGIHVGGWASAPIMSFRKVDTKTGDSLWTSEVESPVTSADYVDGRLIVGLFPLDGLWNGWEISTDRIIVLDAFTGEPIDEVATGLRIVYAE